MIDHDAQLVRSTFSGHVTLVDFFDGRMKVVEHPESRSFVHVLDGMAVTNLDIPDETLRHLASMRPLFDNDALQIVVIKPESPMIPFVRTFQRFAEGTGRNVQVVASLEEANALVARVRAA